MQLLSLRLFGVFLLCLDIAYFVVFVFHGNYCTFKKSTIIFKTLFETLFNVFSLNLFIKKLLRVIFIKCNTHLVNDLLYLL